MSIINEYTNNTPEPEDPYAVIFWETYYRLQEDIDWLTAQPNTEFSLLARYFRKCLKGGAKGTSSRITPNDAGFER